MCTDIEWDPTGRYVATGVSHFRHQTENGYNLWSSQGKLLGRHLKEKFYALQWRPRPPSMLDDDQEREVRKNLREASRCVCRRAVRRRRAARAPSADARRCAQRLASLTLRTAERPAFRRSAGVLRRRT